jgi:hypothetical protein
MFFKKKQDIEIVEEAQEAEEPKVAVEPKVAEGPEKPEEAKEAEAEQEEAAPKKCSLVKKVVMTTGTVAVVAGAVAFFAGTARGRAIAKQTTVAASIYVPKAINCVKAGVQAAIAEASEVVTAVDAVVVTAPAVAPQLPVSCIVSKLR